MKKIYSLAPYFLLSVLIIFINFIWFLPTRDSLRKNISRLETEAAEKAKFATASFLREKAIELENPSGYFKYPLNDPENALVLRKILREKSFSQASLIGKDGKEIFKASRIFSTPLMELENKSESPEFIKTMESGKIFLSEIKLSYNYEPYMTVAFPVFIIEGEMAGVVSGELSIRSVFDYIAGIKIGELGQAYIVDGKGILIAHPDLSLVLKNLDYSSRKIVSDVLARKETIVSDGDEYVYSNEDNAEVLAAAAYIPETDWAVVFEEPRGEALRPLLTIEVFFVLVIFLGLAVAFVLRTINAKLAKAKEKLQEAGKVLQAERDRSQAIISSVGEGLLVIDRDSKIILMNKVAENLLGTSFKDAAGKDLKKIVSVFKGDEEVSDAERPMTVVLKTGEAAHIRMEDNFYYKLSSGKKFPVEIVATPLRGEGVMAAVVVFQDISKEKALDEAKNSFISIASHQFRTPITSIRWHSEILDSEDVGALNKEQKEFVRRIYGGALKMNEVINLLLSLTKAESGKLEQKLVKINLAAFTADILKDLEAQFKQKNAKVNVVLPEETLPEIVFDVSVLRQIVSNLLSNSARYTDSGGRVEIKIGKSGEGVVYTVKDDGIGIPESQKSEIFNKFFRAENAVKKVPDGSGLGLSLVKSLVEMNNGKIWFESPVSWDAGTLAEKKAGTAFHFTIPLK